MDPELQAVVDLLPPGLADPAVAFADPVALRLQLAEVARLTAEAGLAPVPDARVSRRDLAVPGPAGAPDVAVRFYEPESAAPGGPVFLHIHGGAFVIGGIEQDDNTVERLALATGVCAVSVDYRLAPEHLFPSGADDCWAVYRWLAGGNSGLDVNPERIVVTGVSAGGALAASVAQRARDEGGVQPIFQLLLYPVLDDRMLTHSMRTHIDTKLWNGRSSVHMWRLYLGEGYDSAQTSPYAAPGRAKDLSGLPPTFIGTAELDPLRDEAIEYAERLMQAGIPTELHVVPGAIHAFDNLTPDSRLGSRVRESRYAAVRTFLSRTPQELAVKPGERWLDPEVATVADFLPVGDPDDIVAARKFLDEMLGGGGGVQPGEDRLVVTQPSIPGPEGAPEIPLRVYQPRDAQGPVPCVVDFHGGAFVMGSTGLDHPANVRIASQLGAVVVSVEYRLAPEHPFPAGVEDCYAALVWVHEHAAELGIDPSLIAVTGGSAGGALAAAVTLMARDRGGPPICFQSLIIPVTDDRMSTWSMATFVDTPMFNRPGAEIMWERYLGPGYEQRETSPYAAPLRAADLSGLPPAYVQTAELDPLRDEGIAYARRLLEAGVPVELHCFPGTFHGSGAAVEAAVSRRASGEAVDVLGAAFDALKPPA